jgi:hypothetical protein
VDVVEFGSLTGCALHVMVSHHMIACLKLSLLKMEVKVGFRHLWELKADMKTIYIFK